jgi:hypothetical protein
MRQIGTTALNGSHDVLPISTFPLARLQLILHISTNQL